MAKQVSSPVPAPAPVTDIQDPAVRRAIQNLIDTHNTRNGNTPERFLTEADIKDLSAKIVVAGMGRLASSSAGGPYAELPGWGSVGDVVTALENIVRKDPLFIKLGENIEFLTEQNSLSLAKIASLGDGFFSEHIERLEGETRLLQETTAMKVSINSNSAAILEEAAVRVTADSALASQITTLNVVVGQNTATIQNNQQVQSNWNSAAAQSITTLQAQVTMPDGTPVRNALQTESSVRSSADGNLAAHYTTKIDQNGWVSGFGLMSTTTPNSNPTSAFYVRADRFAIGSPNSSVAGPTPNPANVPFIVQTTATTDPATGTPIPPGVYMRDAFIKNASVDTLKIAGNSVTVPLFVQGWPGGSIGPNTEPYTVLTVTGFFPAPGHVTAMMFVTAASLPDYVSTNVRVRLLRNGASVSDHSTSTEGGFTESHSFTAGFTVAQGWNTFQMQIGNNWPRGSPWSAWYVSMTILGTMR